LPLPAIGYSPKNFAPVSGVVRVLVIAAAFADINSTLSINQLQQNWFGRVAAYYHEISYGTLTIQGDIRGWYKLPYGEAHYGADCLSIDDADCSGSDSSYQIAQDAVNLAKNDVNFSNYNYFIFIHSGYGEESTGSKPDVWSVTYMGGPYIMTKQKTLTLYSIVPELEAGGAVTTGVYCLEFGHDLWLPDLYDTTTGSTILGPWELMDKGSWNGFPPGSSPAHMSAWDKVQLGFISGSMLAYATSGVTSNFTIDPTEVASSNVHAVKIQLSSASQYYYVEVRALIGFDSALPASGVLITYVDENNVIGKVHVIDGHPNVPDLNDAVWNVGQTFTDQKNNVAVTVTGKIGNSYQVTVNRGGGSPPPNQNQTSTTSTSIITTSTSIITTSTTSPNIQLGIISINVSPPVITSPNTNVTISIQISNTGMMAATDVLVQVALDGQVYNNLQVPSIGAGSSTEANFTWISTAGSHVFQITLDPNNTINEPSRANHVVTFNLSVGPTLSINVPTNITSTSNIWVMINGVNYNLTSGSLQTSVPTGITTVQIQNAVNVSQGVREMFTGWSDGSSSNPRQLTVSNDTTLQAVYRAQYLLSVTQNGGNTTPSGWYNATSVATVSANATSNVIPNLSRLVFVSWSGDYNSTSTSLFINMTKPVAVQANWISQYYVTVLSTAGSPSGTGWYNSGTNASISVEPVVQFTNETRDVFVGWNMTTPAQAPSIEFRVDSPTRLEAFWKTQYLIQVTTQYGSPSGSGWYDAGSLATISIQPQLDYGNGTRRLFTGWTGDHSGTETNFTLTASNPRSVTAEWTTQYQITFKVSGIPNSTIITLKVDNATHQISVNQPYSTWYDRGKTLNPTANQTATTFFQFQSWRNSTSSTVAIPITVTGPETYTAAYAPALALGVPGFPIESIIVGMALGILMLMIAKRSRRRSD
jgi:M6 family metalloprotease-like protein